jgi:hypothetical protein
MRDFLSKARLLGVLSRPDFNLRENEKYCRGTNIATTLAPGRTQQVGEEVKRTLPKVSRIRSAQRTTLWFRPYPAIHFFHHPVLITEGNSRCEASGSHFRRPK